MKAVVNVMLLTYKVLVAISLRSIGGALLDMLLLQPLYSELSW